VSRALNTLVIRMSRPTGMDASSGVRHSRNVAMKLAIRSFFALSLGLSLHAAAWTQGYPEKPIKVIVPYAAGGGSDVITRLAVDQMGKILKQPIIVENKGGASGMIGADAVAKAPPDGYTVLMSNISLVMNEALYPKQPYDTHKDFQAVTAMATVPALLVAHPAAPFKNVKELIGYAKSKPKDVTVGTAGLGQPSHLAAELLDQMSGAPLSMVHYKGNAPALTDLMGGHIMLNFGTVPASIGHVRNGKLRALGVASSKRLHALPDVPTIAETVPGFEMMAWQGLFVPAKTPRPIVEKLQKAVAEALTQAPVQKRLAEEGAEPVGSTPEQFDKVFRDDLVRWAKLIKERNIKADQ